MNTEKSNKRNLIFNPVTFDGIKTFDKMINNDKEQIDLLHSIINDQIDRVRNQQNLQFEIGVLEDLRRMAELGCFTVFTTQPNLFEMKLSENDTKISVNCQVPRMMWTGEETISKLRTENDILKVKIQDLESKVEISNSNISISERLDKLQVQCNFNGDTRFIRDIFEERRKCAVWLLTDGKSHNENEREIIESRLESCNNTIKQSLGL